MMRVPSERYWTKRKEKAPSTYDRQYAKTISLNRQGFAKTWREIVGLPNTERTTDMKLKTHRSPDAWDIEHPTYLIRIWIGELIQITPLADYVPGESFKLLVEKTFPCADEKHPDKGYYVVDRSAGTAELVAEVKAGPFPTWESAVAAMKIIGS